MITVLTTDAELAALRPEWEALWERSPAATPFQSPRWLLPWWRHFGTGLPRVAIRRRNRQLDGILPLYILPDERKLLPIGAGTTDYLDALGNAEGLLETALLQAETDQIDTCDLIDIPATSPLTQAAAPNWTASWRDDTPCPVLELPHIDKTARRKLAMNRHRADRMGGWAVATADAATLHADLDDLARLHQARWTAQGHPGVFADPRLRAFLHDAAADLLDAGLLRLQRLTIAGDTAALIAACLAPSRIFFYLSGFDQAHAFASPGTILLGAMLEQAIHENRTEAHFLRGRESYKYVWGATDRCNRAGHYKYPAPASASKRSGAPSQTMRACSST